MSRQDKIACRVTAREMTASRFKRGFYRVQKHLVLWVEGSTNSNRVTMDELARLKDDVKYEVMNDARDVPELPLKNAARMGSLTSTDKGVYAVAFLFAAPEDIAWQMEIMEEAGWKLSKPVSK